MSKYFKLTVSSMSMHYLYIKTPDDINEDDIHMNFRKFDSECFDPNDVGTWDLDSVTEIDEDEFDETKMYHCKWEDRYQ